MGDGLTNATVTIPDMVYAGAIVVGANLALVSTSVREEKRCLSNERQSLNTFSPARYAVKRFEVIPSIRQWG
jgi:hypothetical protein